MSFKNHHHMLYRKKNLITLLRIFSSTKLQAATTLTKIILQFKMKMKSSYCYGVNHMLPTVNFDYSRRNYCKTFKY